MDVELANVIIADGGVKKELGNPVVDNVVLQI